MDGIANWIKEKKYEQAVEIVVSSSETNELLTHTLPGSSFYEFHPQVRVNKVYLCPRGILSTEDAKIDVGLHVIKPEMASMSMKMREYWKTVIIERKIVIDFDMLKEAREDEF